MSKALGKDSTCSIARSLEVIGDAWTLLIVREAMIAGATRFQEFRDALGVAPNILIKRLDFLVDAGVMARQSYREAGARAREEYVLTESGRSLSLVVAALATWGREYRPRPDGTSPQFSIEGAHTPARLAFIDPHGDVVAPEGLVARRTSDKALLG
jgi:DNA-binding HxlR family transcriptional regulator